MSSDKDKSAGGNPLKYDPELRSMLDKLEMVKTSKAFKRWKGSFLSRFEYFLEQGNIKCAEKAYKDFSKSMGNYIKMVREVEDFIEKGELTVAKYTVKARNCLAEMSKTMSAVIQEKDDLIPQTGAAEKQRGYNKFHIGAVLVRDGFEEYGRLTMVGDILKHMRKVSLNEVADKQILEEMDNYSIKLQKFCDVMADLGLYEVMLKCREFAEEEDDLDDLIFLDLKTGSIGELPREDAIGQRLVAINGKDANGNDVFAEAETDPEKQEKLMKLITTNPRLGIGFGNIQNAYEEEAIEIGDREKIASMWGVTLKKTPKNVKGEELVFVDQKTGAFGEMSRKMSIEKGILTEVKDEKGKFIIGEGEQDFQERANLVENIRRLLKVGVGEEKK